MGDGGPLDSDAMTGTDAEVTCSPPGLICVATNTGTMTGTISTGTTVGAGDDLRGSCGGNGEPDIAVQWTAPETGRWLIDTNGSAFDTLLYVRTACDAGAQIGCNDDEPVGSGTYSVLTIDAMACETFMIAVDGANGGGAYTLNARLKCPSADLGSALGAGVVSGSLQGWSDSYSGMCGGATEPDKAYTWTAPATGTYRFSTQGSSFDTILSLYSSCAGTELVCNDDDPGGGTTSSLNRSFVAGESVVIVIDTLSGSGSYTLAITAL